MVKTLAFVLLLSAGSALRADQWDKHWDVTGSPELQVNAGDGSVSIRGTDSSGIDAHVEVRGWKIGAGGVEIHEELTGNRLELTVKEPHVIGWQFGDHSIKIELRVPRHLTANLRTGDGPIALSQIQGTVDARTGDGPVDVKDFNGVLHAATGDGPVSLHGRFDDLEVNTGDGPVSIAATSGSQIHTAWHVKTGDGPVHVGLPSDLHANVDLHTGDGGITLNLPLSVQGRQNQHDLHGALNGGGGEIRIQTGDGSISIGKS